LRDARGVRLAQDAGALTRAGPPRPPGRPTFAATSQALRRRPRRPFQPPPRPRRVQRWSLSPSGRCPCPSHIIRCLPPPAGARLAEGLAGSFP
jgi:hypothetical protein